MSSTDRRTMPQLKRPSNAKSRLTGLYQADIARVRRQLFHGSRIMPAYDEMHPRAFQVTVTGKQ